MNEKWNELLQDEAFLEKLLNLESDTEVQAFLAENGVELSLTEIASIKAGIESRLAADDAELSEDDLENVAGGADVADIITAVFDGIGKLGDYVHKWTRRRW